MALPWQEEASCFAVRAHCWTLRGGGVCVSVFCKLLRSLRRGLGTGEEGSEDGI